MKMPEKIDNSMFAHCGMNCTVCHKHCDSKEKCCGCISNLNTKLEHCRKCKIKSCVIEKGFKYCFECSEFPCKLSKELEKRYEKYNWSLITNSEDAKEDGIDIFLESNRKYWICDKCGGVMSMYYQECSDCHAKLNDMRLGPYAHFGIIDCFDERKDYASLYKKLSFSECLKKYNCISIPDIIINDWWHSLIPMKSYYNTYNRIGKSLARWGVTLIPPDSLDLFAKIIQSSTSERHLCLCKVELENLLKLLKKAKCENKFVIHYGV